MKNLQNISKTVDRQELAEFHNAQSDGEKVPRGGEVGRRIKSEWIIRKNKIKLGGGEKKERNEMEKKVPKKKQRKRGTKTGRKKT